MIALTDTSAYPDVEYIAPGTNIGLTTTHVNNIPTSAIINATITTNVKALLNSILSNSNVNSTAKTAIATYSGFSVNAAGVISFSSSNVSIDKLTFYVIFRLPHTGTGLTYEDIAEGETSSSIASNPTTWGKYANYIRTLSGAGLKKLRSEGVNFDLAADFFTTKPGYEAVGALTNTDGHEEYETTLFDGTTSYNKLPVSFFKIAQDENNYKVYWKTRQYYRPHWPTSAMANDQLKDKDAPRRYYEREITGQRIINGNGTPITKDDFTRLYREYIYLESSNPNVYAVTDGNFHYRFALKDTSDKFFNLVGCEVLFYKGATASEIIPGTTYTGTFKIIARKPDPNGDNGIAMTMNRDVDERRYLIQNYILREGSGLTFGAGIDSGAAFTKAYQRKTSFEFNLANTVSNFRIGLGDKRSNEIAYSTNMTSALQGAIRQVLQSFLEEYTFKRMCESADNAASLVTVAKVNDHKYTININCSIRYILPNLFYSPTSGVTFTNITSSNPERASFQENWQTLKTIFLRSFNISVTNFTYQQIDSNMQCYVQAGITNTTEQQTLQNLIKSLVGVRGPMSWVHFRNNFGLLRKFKFGTHEFYVYHLRALYNYFYKTHYYDVAYNAIKNGIEVKLNEAEKYVIASIVYNTGSIPSERKKEIRLAINSHNPKLLKEVVNKISWGGANRASLIRSFIDLATPYLYKNV
ncbi:hypothetical protein AMR72_15145 [Flavobacterium psychrophilum]|nr:hypothetical protein AMR72_15145 [Flavobacterium psychrophilum]AOE53735.1 hypothetical protein ALW18_15135 [Flavobacterium psychrophilum]